MDVGTFLLMLGLSYALGLLWYDLLPSKLPEQVWRVAAYPFLGIFVAEALLPSVLPFDPRFGNLHLLTVLIGSLVAVVVDWLIRQARHPSLVLINLEQLRQLPARPSLPQAIDALGRLGVAAIAVRGRVASTELPIACRLAQRWSCVLLQLPDGKEGAVSLVEAKVTAYLTSE